MMNELIPELKKEGEFEYKIAGDFELMLIFLEKHNIRSKYNLLIEI